MLLSCFKSSLVPLSLLNLKTKLLQSVIIGIMVQHQTEVRELQCLLRNTQEKLHIQVQTTVDQVRYKHS